jgi:hypothetical protein
MAHSAYAESDNDSVRELYTTYIARMEDSCCRIEFFFDGIPRKNASVFQIFAPLVGDLWEVESCFHHDRVLAHHWVPYQSQRRYTSELGRVPSL